MRFARLTVADEFDATQQTHAAHVANLLEAPLEIGEPGSEILAHLRAALEQAILLDGLEHRQAHAGGQRVGDVRGIEREPALMAALLHLVAGDDRRERHAAAQGLGHRHDVGGHAQVRGGEPVAQPAEGRLGLVEDQQHAPAPRLGLQGLEVTSRAAR